MRYFSAGISIDFEKILLSPIDHFYTEKEGKGHIRNLFAKITHPAGNLIPLLPTPSEPPFRYFIIFCNSSPSTSSHFFSPNLNKPRFPLLFKKIKALLATVLHLLEKQSIMGASISLILSLSIHSLIP